MAQQTVRKASRKNARMRVGISAPAGAGKTMGALLIAYGLVEDWTKIGLLDTETGSGELYVGLKVPGSTMVIGEYCYWRLDPPYTIAKYIEGQKALEEAGCEVVILDSITHAWAGSGGLLDKQGKIAARSGNSYTAWRDVTPDHTLFVDTMLSSPSHIIATMRAKTEYVQEKDEKGKTTIRKVGLAPVQREGMDYEFVCVFDIEQTTHTATATKDRTSLFDGEFFKLSPDVGKKMRVWADSGVAVASPPPAEKRKGLRDMMREAVAATSSLDDIRAIENRQDVRNALLKAGPEIKAEMEAIIRDGYARFPAPEAAPAAPLTPAQWLVALGTDLEAAQTEAAVSGIAARDDVQNALAKAPAPVVAKINAMVSAALARFAPEAERMET